MSILNPTSYNYPTNVRFGEGVISELADYLIANQLSKPLIATDPNVAKLDFFHQIVADLQKRGISVEVFSDIYANPVKGDVLKGGEAFHATNRDSVIGIGGGAGMDVERAIVLRVNHHRDLFDYDDLIGGDKYVTEEVPHFITVPTTSGTGSEVGRSAIISEDDTKRKRILFAPKLMAKKVFADPALTYDLPPHITASTGMDAFTHNIEAFLAKGFHPMADGIALEGIRLITESIETATRNPTPESRAKMMIASLMGATAFQKGLGVVHSLAHPLSTLLDMHHGLANAINLPYGMRFNLSGFEEKFRMIAWAMNLKSDRPESVIDALFELNTKLDIPHKLSEAGVKENHLEPLADLAIADFAHPNNPKPVSREDFRRLYEEAF